MVLRFLGGQEVFAARGQIEQVYREAFGAPPYLLNDFDVIGFRKALERHAARDGFRFAAIFPEPGGPLAGFAYGYTSRPGQWWHDIVAGALTARQQAEWLGDCFELAELAVAPAHQGRRYGSRLHDQLLHGLPHRTAALSTLPEPTTAQRLYQKRGWEVILDRVVFPGGYRAHRILGLDLVKFEAR